MTIILIVAAAFFTALMFYKTLGPWLEREDASNLIELDDEMRQLEELVSQKAMLMQSLRELEFDLELDKITQEDYTQLKRRYERQTITIMRKLDMLHGGRGWESKIEDELNRRIAQEQPEEAEKKKVKAKTKTKPKTKTAKKPSEVAAEPPQAEEKPAPAETEAEAEAEATAPGKAEAPVAAEAKAEAEPVVSAGQEVATPATTQTISCPECDKLMELDARFCSQCGATLVPPEAVASSPSPSSEEVRS